MGLQRYYKFREILIFARGSRENILWDQEHSVLNLLQQEEAREWAQRGGSRDTEHMGEERQCHVYFDNTFKCV